MSEEKLYATDVNNSALRAVILLNADSIIKCLVFTTLAILLLYLLAKYSNVCVNDCKKTIDNEWYVIYINICTCVTSNSGWVVFFLFFVIVCVSVCCCQGNIQLHDKIKVVK